MNINELNDELIGHYFPMLTEAKQKKIASLQNIEDRKIFFCCEILARKCLSELCDAPEFSFDILCNPNSKSIVGNYNAEVSIVKCDEFVACAVSNNYVGIGIQKIKSFSFRDAQNLFSDSEIRAIFSDSVYSFSDIVNFQECKEISVMQKYALFSTLKEAHFFASGRGIRSEIKNTVFNFNGREILCSDENAKITDSYIDSSKNLAVSVIERCKK